MSEILSWVLLSLGGFFALTAAIGVLKFPDFYSRLHPAGTGDTLAQFLIMIGLIPFVGSWLDGAKLVLITILLFVTTPTSTHAISQAAHLEGLLPWSRKEKSHG